MRACPCPFACPSACPVCVRIYARACSRRLTLCAFDVLCRVDEERAKCVEMCGDNQWVGFTSEGKWVPVTHDFFTTDAPEYFKEAMANQVSARLPTCPPACTLTILALGAPLLRRFCNSRRLPPPRRPRWPRSRSSKVRALPPPRSARTQ